MDLRQRYGPWALVTGGAMGLGAAFAEHLAAAGLNLALVDHDAEALGSKATELRGRHGTIEVHEVVADLADRAQVEAAVSSVAELEIGLLVACAAHSGVGAWLAVSIEDKIRQIEVNCVSVATMVDRFSRAMVERKRGGIVIVSSMAGRQGTPLVATYAATKAFDLVLGESLWAELRRHGVDVLSLMPGTTRTPGFERSLAPGTKLPKAVRMMEPSDVAREALAALGKQPSLVAGGWNRLAASVMHRVLPRKKAIEVMARSMRSMYRDKT
ncbi:MAG: SDR family NAD(P)-dependent oxidoreductase [Actinomycetota bacterium]